MVIDVDDHGKNEDRVHLSALDLLYKSVFFVRGKKKRHACRGPPKRTLAPHRAISLDFGFWRLYLPMQSLAKLIADQQIDGLHLLANDACKLLIHPFA